MLNVKKNIPFLIFVFPAMISESALSMSASADMPSFPAQTPPLPVATSLLRRALQNSPQFTPPPKLQPASAPSIDPKQREEEERLLIEEQWRLYRAQQYELAQEAIRQDEMMQRLARAQRDAQEFVGAGRNNEAERPQLPPLKIIPAGDMGTMFDFDEQQ
jgi:hypothetical protein